ncbi:ECF transporter S component [uncultured Ruminococcus sp.]|uniref:ECF transporter S component n=1 Tax=uncultured Ruminococcus sp. TaxID=165186 RepID=UPI000ED860E7|nr:ECF transporter S component [uncultured Ruminococcus sp.]HCJ42025.1 ECF transporter S component [Ruminococcus sp.]
MTRNSKTKDLVLMGVMTAIIFIMGLTPIGFIKTGTLSITLIPIPVAIAAYALGPVGGTLAGLSFGITSAITAFIKPDKTMVVLISISVVKVAALCIVPRVLVGFCAGMVAKLMKGLKVTSAMGGALTGFSVAFLNTVFFMSSLVALFGNSEAVKAMKGERNLVLFIIAIVTVNVIIEWVCSTVITSYVAGALTKARLISTPAKKAEA